MDGQGREAIANSGAYQGTTAPEDCWLCYISTAPFLSLTSKERQDATGIASAAL